MLAKSAQGFICIIFVSALISMLTLSTTGDSRPTTVAAIDTSEMILIPGGTYTIGGDEGASNSLPKRTITIRPFYIDKYEVTNAQYQRFILTTKHRPPFQQTYHPWRIGYFNMWTGTTPPDGLENHPVVYVSWRDANAYAKWAGKRLPTEEEWEVAARGTDGRLWPWGNRRPDATRCTFNDNRGRFTSPVGSYPRGASPFGVMDMAGNVSEWTTTLWDDTHNWRVIRGGNCHNGARDIRCASRDFQEPRNSRWGCLGFRCVKDVIWEEEPE